MPNNTTNQETFKTLDAVKQYQIKSMTTMPNELTDFQEVQTQSLILSDLMGKLVDLYTDIIYNEDYTNIDIDMIKKIHKEFSRKSKSIMNLRFGELNEEAILEMSDSNLNLGPVIKIMVGSTRKMSRLLEWVEFMNMASIAYSIFISHFVNINKNRILYKNGYIIATPALYTRLVLRNETEVSFDFSQIQTAVDKIIKSLLNGESWSNKIIHGDYLIHPYYTAYDFADFGKLRHIECSVKTKPSDEYGTSANTANLLRNFTDLYSENISWYVMHSVLTVMSCAGYKFVPHTDNSEIFTIVFCPDTPAEEKDSEEEEAES